MKKLIASLWLIPLVGYCALAPDIVKTLDMTGQASVTATILNQLVDTAVIKDGKGIIIASATPPTVSVNNRYTNFLWLDISTAPPVLKLWVTVGLGSSPDNTTNWSSSVVGPGSITASLLANGAVTEDKIGAAAVSNSKIQTNSVSSSQLQANSVGTSQIQDSAVSNIKLGANSVTSSKIADGEIIAQDIANGTITADKLAFTINTNFLSGMIYNTNIAGGTILSSNIAGATIVASNIANGTITSNQIASGTITSNQIASGTITANQIATGTITTTNLSFPFLPIAAYGDFEFTGGGTMTISNYTGCSIVEIANNRVSLIYSNALTSTTNYIVMVQEQPQTLWATNTWFVESRSLTNTVIQGTQDSVRYIFTIFAK